MRLIVIILVELNIDKSFLLRTFILMKIIFEDKKFKIKNLIYILKLYYI